MQHVKALKPHVYAGKRRNVGDVYQIRRTDKALYQRIGAVEFVEDPNGVFQYRTAAMEAAPEPVKKKRPYVRKKKPE